MKKKFLAIYALTGALVASPIFTSCVDDNESASVTAVRTAKAEQLKALANYQNAQAEAERIRAEAEAAYKNAMAEYQKEQTEQSKQTFAIQLEAIKAEAETRLVEAKQKADAAEKLILKAAEDRITDLYEVYAKYSKNIAEYNSNIITETANIAKLEANLLSVQAYVKQKSTNYNRTIAANEAAIKILNEATGVDKDALNIQQEELFTKWKLASANLETKEGAAKTAATNVYNKANTNLDVYYNWWDPNIKYNVASSLATIEAARQLHDLACDLNYYEDPTTQEITYWPNNNNLSHGYSFIKMDKSEALILVQEDVVIYQQDKANYIKNLKGWLGTEQDAKDATYLGALTHYAQLAQAKEDFNTASALPETDATKNSKLDAANIAIAKANDLIAEYNKYIAESQASLDDFNKLIATFTGTDYEEYQKALAEVAKLEEAKEAAEKAYDKAEIEVNNIYAEYEVINNLYNNGTSISDEIAKCEADIAKAKADMANIKQQIGTEPMYNDDPYNPQIIGWLPIFESEDTVKAAISYAKANIENLKAKIEVETALANKAKKELDAALAE